MIAVIQDQMEKGTIILRPVDLTEPPAKAVSSGDPLFGSFRQALKKLTLTENPLKPIEALVRSARGFTTAYRSSPSKMARALNLPDDTNTALVESVVNGFQQADLL